MLVLMQFHGLTLAVCVALGAATSWWMFRGDRAKRREREKGKAKS